MFENQGGTTSMPLAADAHASIHLSIHPLSTTRFVRHVRRRTNVIDPSTHSFIYLSMLKIVYILE